MDLIAEMPRASASDNAWPGTPEFWQSFALAHRCIYNAIGQWRQTRSL